MSGKAKVYPMTRVTYDELREELRQKIEEERLALSARLKGAIEMGDLSENADYHAAKEAQAFLEGRILELQELIDGAKIILDSDIRRYTVVEVGDDEEETLMIVGATESDPGQGKISNESPLGKALLNSKQGQTVTVKTPVGELTYKVLEIQ